MHAQRLLALAGSPDLDEVLRRVLRSARSLAGAHYGALGVPDGRGGFHRFLTVGIPERRAERIGTLPRRHGVLGVLLEDSGPIRLDDISRHPRFTGYPYAHPRMRDFLGVSIRHRGEALGNLYLSGSRAGGFSAADQRVVEALAAYAGIAIANARLHARSQELVLLQERARVAQELHDSVSQTLFSMVYEARAAAAKADGGETRQAIAHLEDLAAGALRDMRRLVQELRPKALERDGLATVLRDHVAGLRRLHELAIEDDIAECPGLTPNQEHALLRIAQEALHNVLRHAPGAHACVRLGPGPDGVGLRIQDDGPGFDPERLSRTERRMGLAGMRERAATARGRLTVRTAPGRGCTIAVTVPVEPGDG